MIESLQNGWQGWAIGVGTLIAVSAFLRMAKKQKWAKKLQVAGVNSGKWFSFMLLRWLPPTAAQKAEEGIIVTALSLVKAFIDGFEIGILADNNTRNLKKGGLK